MKKSLTSDSLCPILNKSSYGELAQLGERLNGIQEVRGSIPLFSIMEKSIVLCFETACTA